MFRTFLKPHFIVCLLSLFSYFSYSNPNSITIENNDNETHRFYLNFKKNNTSFNQSLIVYSHQATNGFDFGVDSAMFNYNGSALFSLIEGVSNYYIIQGRAMPFTDQDVVKLGIRIIEAGNFRVELGNHTGVFSESQDIFILDKHTQATHNLKDSNFEFYSEAGTFLNRFEIVYKEAPSIWTGSAWLNGVPTSEKDALIQGNLVIDEIYEEQYGELAVNNLTIAESGSLLVSSDLTVFVSGTITNKNTASAFILENDSNLVQTNNQVNSGSISVKRNTTIKHLDYTIWSSPVLGQKLKAFSPYTLNNRIRIYDTTDNTWKIVSNPETTDFVSGSGVMFRAPNADNNPGTPYLWTGTFIGTAQNGEIRYNFNQHAYGTGIYQSVGNPYPSNISIDSFKSENPTVGTLYFWTNTNAPTNGEYLANNWATYSELGGAAAENGQSQPNQTITVGQGFVVETNGLVEEISFQNSMRTSNNGVFFRSAVLERHRFWLDLSVENQGLNQILVGYMDGASNAFDFGIDSKLFNYSGSAIYTLVEQSDDIFVIQGRALPFDDSDIVPLGFRATTAGSFNISLSNFDGIFVEGQDIFLKDNFTQTEHNLKNGDYSFVSEIGTFDNRFEIIYRQGNMSVYNPNLNNNWVVYKNGNSFHIQTQDFEMSEVIVHDMLGRIIYNSKNVNSDSHHFPALDSDQVLVVKIKTTDNKQLSKKVI